MDAQCLIALSFLKAYYNNSRLLDKYLVIEHGTWRIYRTHVVHTKLVEWLLNDNIFSEYNKGDLKYLFEKIYGMATEWSKR